MTYLWLDATYVKAREDGRVRSKALVAAIGVREDGCRPMMAALVRTIFVQADLANAKRQLGRVVETLQTRYPKAADLLASAEEDILAHLSFPEAHRKRIHSTNPLERLHKEIKQRSNVVGIFPNRSAVLRLVGALLAEQNDEWQSAGATSAPSAWPRPRRPAGLLNWPSPRWMSPRASVKRTLDATAIMPYPRRKGI